MRVLRFFTRWVILSLIGCGAAPPPAGTSTTDTSPTETSTSETSVSETPTLAIPNQASPEPGVVTGGHPDEDDLRAAAAAGYVMVISLQTQDEPDFEAERALVEQLSMRFASIEMRGAEGISQENARQLDALLTSREGPVIVHCGSGNRAGALMAARAFLNGSSIDDAIALGQRAGLRGLLPEVRARLEAWCAEDPSRTC